MPLLADRVEGLMLVKGRLKQDELPGISRETLTRWLNGHRKISVDDLKRLAEALESTSDYLIGLGDDYRIGTARDNYAFAASKMSFDYFKRYSNATSEQKQRCRRVWEDDRLLMRDGAPLTAEAWRSLAEMIDRAVPKPQRIGSVKGA